MRVRSLAEPAMLAIAVVTLLICSAAHAQTSQPTLTPSTCRAHLGSGVGDAAWTSAIAQVQAHVDSVPLEEHDCDDIDVHVTSDGALVVFTTRDGRKAVR